MVEVKVRKASSREVQLFLAYEKFMHQFYFFFFLMPVFGEDPVDSTLVVFLKSIVLCLLRIKKERGARKK